MKAFQSFVRVAIAAVILAVGSDRALAQTESKTIRGDVAATVGWLSANIPSSTAYDDDDWVSSLFGTVSGGWHWTDNVKTELDFGAGTKVSAYRTDPITIDGRPTYQTTRTTFSRRTLGIGQQYQFFHNVWFHPHLAAGATVTWERATARGNPIFIYDAVRGAQFAAPETVEGPRTSVRVRPFVASGFKAYMTDRAFFRSDLRVAFRGGPDDVVLRIGFGIDF